MLFITTLNSSIIFVNPQNIFKKLKFARIFIDIYKMGVSDSIKD